MNKPFLWTKRTDRTSCSANSLDLHMKPRTSSTFIEICEHSVTPCNKGTKTRKGLDRFLQIKSQNQPLDLFPVGHFIRGGWRSVGEFDGFPATATYLYTTNERSNFLLLTVMVADVLRLSYF